MQRRGIVEALAMVLLSASSVQSGGMMLLGQEAPPVVVLALPFDGDVYFARPADHFQAGAAQDVVLDHNGGLTLPPGGTRGSYTSPVLPTGQFNGMMLSFTGECPLGAIIAIFIRCIVDGMAGEWVRFDPEQESLLNGLASGFQYRVDMQQSPGSTTSPSVNSVNLAVSNLTPEWQSGRMGQNAGQQIPWNGGSVSRPNVVSRAAWGATAARGQTTLSRPTAIVIHHTAGTKGGIEQVRGIQRYHQRDNGWSDIGYHFLVSADGQVFEGRPENVQGAHVAGANSYSLGISAIGHYSRYDVDGPCWDAIVRTTAYLCARYGISPSRVVGHQDMARKDCPGRYIYNRLPQLRQSVARLLGQSGVTTD